MSILIHGRADQLNEKEFLKQANGHGGGAPVNGISHVKGDTSSTLEDITIPQMLRRTASQFGAQEAFVFSDTAIRLTYGELDEEVDALASGFLALGLEKGDRVGIWSPNRYEWVLTQFATARIGLVLVNINPAYGTAELEFALRKVECKALILASSYKSSNYLSSIRELVPELQSCDRDQLRSERVPALKYVVVMDHTVECGAYTFQQIQEMGGPEHAQSLAAIEKSLNPHDAINIQFTSGTTGAPKGATLSHYNIVNNAKFVTDRMHMTNADRLCIPVPLYHCFGMVMGVLGAVSKGFAMVFPGEAFDPVATLQTLSAERCTAVYGVPTMFIAMLQEMEGEHHNLSALRTGIMAGAPCPVHVMEQVISQMNMQEVTICYGMTETSPVSFQSFIEDPIEKRCSTVGKVHPHLEVKIVDEDGKIVPVGAKGELCTKGYAVMKGYWNDEERTRESIVDGWMHTGDLATMDSEGFCAIVGRVKDMIIRGGENIYPREIEEFLFRHPDISEAQVFGIPHEKYGEEVAAWIVPKPGTTISEDKVRQFCEGQIAYFKIPKYIQIVDQIPTTISGKPQKFVMRDLMIEKLSNPTRG